MKDKTPRVIALLPQVFAWAREAHPSQPLTSGVCAWTLRPTAQTSPEIQQIQLRESDIITFHNYTLARSLQAAK